MGYHPITRSREYVEGWIGRRRKYICRICREKFRVDTLKALPEHQRTCPDCRNGNYLFIFTNTQTGRDTRIRATDSELATLRAWEIDHNLTIKIPQDNKELANVQ